MSEKIRQVETEGVLPVGSVDPGGTGPPDSHQTHSQRVFPPVPHGAGGTPESTSAASQPAGPVSQGAGPSQEVDSPVEIPDPPTDQESSVATRSITDSVSVPTYSDVAAGRDRPAHTTSLVSSSTSQAPVSLNQKNIQKISVPLSRQLLESFRTQRKTNDPNNPKGYVYRVYEPPGLYNSLAQFRAEVPPTTVDSERGFALSESITGHVGPNSYFRKQQIYDVVSNATEAEKLFHALENLPENDVSVQFHIDNQSKMSRQTMDSILRQEAFNLQDQCLEVYRKKYGNLLLAITKIPEIADLSVDDTLVGCERLNAVNKLRNEVTVDLANAIAYHFLANARFVGNKVHLPGAKLDHIIRGAALSLVKNGDFWIPSRLNAGLIKLALRKIVCTTQFVNQEDDAFFMFRESVEVQNNFMWMTITCRIMDDPQFFYKARFLNPKDSITGWKQQPSNKPGYMEFDARLSLGTSSYPRTRGSDDLLERQVADFLPRRNHIAKAKEYLREGKTSKNPFIQKQYLDHKKEWEQIVAEGEEYLAKIDAVVSKSVRDQYDMICKVKYCARYCHHCFVTTHSYKECTEKGCKHCHSSRHPSWQCPNRYQKPTNAAAVEDPMPTYEDQQMPVLGDWMTVGQKNPKSNQKGSKPGQSKQQKSSKSAKRPVNAFENLAMETEIDDSDVEILVSDSTQPISSSKATKKSAKKTKSAQRVDGTSTPSTWQASVENTASQPGPLNSKHKDGNDADMEIEDSVPEETRSAVRTAPAPVPTIFTQSVEPTQVDDFEMESMEGDLSSIGSYAERTSVRTMKKGILDTLRQQNRTPVTKQQLSKSGTKQNLSKAVTGKGSATGKASGSALHTPVRSASVTPMPRSSTPMARHIAAKIATPRPHSAVDPVLLRESDRGPRSGTPFPDSTQQSAVHPLGVTEGGHTGEVDDDRGQIQESASQGPGPGDNAQQALGPEQSMGNEGL